MNDGFNEAPMRGEGAIASRVAGLAQRADSMQTTRLDSHVNTLHEMNNQLDRNCMLTNNILVKLRGNMPEEATNSKVAQADPTVMDAISMLDSEIMIKVQCLARYLEELGEII